MPPFSSSKKGIMSTSSTESKPSSCAVKHDAFKPPLGLIPKSALDEEAAVLSFGAEKYETHNWRKGMPWSRMINAALRHLTAFNEGNDFDNESKLHHLAHVRACCAFLIEYMTTHPEFDDRYKKDEVVDLLHFDEMLASLNTLKKEPLSPVLKDVTPQQVANSSLDPPWLRA